MPLLLWIVPALTGFLTSIFTFFTQFLARRFALSIAAIAVIVSITAAFFLAVKNVISAITPVLPDFVNVAVGWFLPPQAITCISVMFAVRVARWAYEWHVKIVQMKLS